MASKSKTKKAPRATPREAAKPAPRTKKAPVEDGLTRAEIELANAAGPGAVATLIKGGGAAKGAARKAAKPTPPAKGKATKPAAATDTPPKAAKPPRERDPRLPKAGTILTRTFGNKEIHVEVLDAGFKYDGRTWRSLSAIAKAVTGTSWNGFLFMGLQTRATKAAAPTETK